MKNHVTEKRLIERDVVVQKSITCNKCGKVMISNENDWAVDENHNEPHEFNCSFGYYSSFDGESWSFDICETCLVDYVKSFSVVPDGFMLDRSFMTIEKDHQKTFDVWKQTGKWEEFMNYTVEELEEFRGTFNEDYFDELIEKCKSGGLEY